MRTSRRLLDRNAKSPFADSAARANISKQTKFQMEKAVKSICSCMTETVLKSMVSPNVYVTPVAVADINFQPEKIQFFIYARPEADTPEFTCFCATEVSSQLRLVFPSVNAEVSYEDMSNEEKLKGITERMNRAATEVWAEYIERWNAVASELVKK